MFPVCRHGAAPIACKNPSLHSLSKGPIYTPLALALSLVVKVSSPCVIMCFVFILQHLAWPYLALFQQGKNLLIWFLVLKPMLIRPCPAYSCYSITLHKRFSLYLCTNAFCTRSSYKQITKGSHTYRVDPILLLNILNLLLKKITR